MTQESTTVLRESSPEHRVDLQYVWHTVTCKDAQAVKLPESAPGIDRIISRQWRAVPASVKALLFNVILARGAFPSEILTSRTVFLAKKKMSVTPTDFKPFSIALVVVRHLHTTLVERLREADLVDLQQ